MQNDYTKDKTFSTAISMPIRKILWDLVPQNLKFGNY